jgi:undecaprenyl-diphosphatase
MREAIFFSLVQGITEFLPISSTGHLFLIKRLLTLDTNLLPFFVFLHLATLFSVTVFFSKVLPSIFKNKKIIVNLALATLTTFIFAFLLKYTIEDYFDSKYLTFIGFITSALFLLIFRKGGQKTMKELQIKDSLLIGFIQSLAIMPGVSRSGITITTLMKRGFKRKEAFEFSFFLAIPTILGAFLSEAKNLFRSNLDTINIVVGFFLAFFSGLFALKMLKKYLERKKLYKFGYYCLVMAIMTIFLAR